MIYHLPKIAENNLQNDVLGSTLRLESRVPSSRGQHPAYSWSYHLAFRSTHAQAGFDSNSCVV